MIKMESWKKYPHILAEITLREQITPDDKVRSFYGDFISCPLLIDGKLFDCRIILNDGAFLFGSTRKKLVAFLDWDYASRYFILGAEFDVMEKIKIGKGIVLSRISDQEG